MAEKKNETAVVAETTENGNLVVVREPINDKNGKQMVTKDGRLYFAYVVRGVIRGQRKKIDFAPKDNGGYEPLDLLFDITPKAELILGTATQEDINGHKREYDTYAVQVVDSDGEVWKCDIKPQRNSDKTLLNFLLIEMRKQAKTATATA